MKNGNHLDLSKLSAKTMTDSEQHQTLEIKALEEKLDSLIELYGSIKNENCTLKSKQEELVREKAKLIEKTTLARTRVEAMISRLKSMEQGT
jgi:cell division protein ZapB